MNGKSINFEDKKINKSNFYKTKKLFNIHDIDVNKILVPNDNDKYIKTKIKVYEDRVNTNFHGKEIPKEDASYKRLLLIVLDSVIRVSKKYYLQTLLEECKYEIKKNKMENLINDDLDLSSSDNETDNESDSD